MLIGGGGGGGKGSGQSCYVLGALNARDVVGKQCELIEEHALTERQSSSA